MKTEKRTQRHGRQLLLAAVGVLLTGGSCLTSCSQYDLDERTPEGWGSSIYNWLEEQGNYTNTVRLIDDLGYREVLAKTGSKTLFVADDAAYERFFSARKWGVGSYAQLSNSQKRLLLFGSMLDNSMQLSALPSVEGTPPTEGESLRRFASTTPYDSVTIFRPDQMPQTAYWQRFRDGGQSIVCMTDNTTVPLVLFIEKMLTNKRITNSDYDFLFNNTTQRQPGEASINGVQVFEPNVKCSNGFIHLMADVVTPLPNMAERIRTKSNVSQYNTLMERFCAPYPDRTPDRDGSVTMQYNDMYGTRVDTVYQKRFFSEKSQNNEELSRDPYGGNPTALLKYDPEWNAFVSGLIEGTGNVSMQRDMGVMLVPSNEAMDNYWKNGAGRILKDQYGSWENVPDDVVAELLNNNMLSSFVNSVPSKFQSILNKDNDPMGVEVADIDSVWLACNGAVYLTNKVYSPNSFVSVLFPALTNESMKIIYWAVNRLKYNIYLNSLNARYSFFIPNNKAMLQYIDPCSYGKAETQLFRFHWDPTRSDDQRVWASIFNYNVETGEVGDSIGRATQAQVENRLKDILETHVIIGDVEDGHEFYRTKGGTMIRVSNVGEGIGHMKVAGSLQVDEQRPVVVSDIYDQTADGNGKSYILSDEPLMTTRKSVDDVLSATPEYSMFYGLFERSGLLETLHNKSYASPRRNISTFNTYHYTIYVPTNESIQKLHDDGLLPTWEQVDKYEDEGNLTAKTRDSLQIVNFVKYHIQDNALFIGAPVEVIDPSHPELTVETALMNPLTERFYLLTARYTTAADGRETIEVNDQLCQDHPQQYEPAHVLTSNPALYNLQAREYLYHEADAMEAVNIETSSSAVIHLIDRPLRYANE
ncbi:MAG: fasciclin domain-containing protein [Prevotella sp.]|nr:fasciclin domain-containing protein [Prevotella sp.]